jgi:hypothetical protein
VPDHSNVLRRATSWVRMRVAAPFKTSDDLLVVLHDVEQAS